MAPQRPYGSAGASLGCGQKPRQIFQSLLQCLALRPLLDRAQVLDGQGPSCVEQGVARLG
jgi:hypothetical protein